MLSIENNAGGTQVSRYTYAVNPITQRESVTTAGLAFGGTQANWRWDYDALGQVVRADNAATNASDRSYAYDNIGNRLTSGAGVSLASLSTYTPNALNQYTQITTSSQPTVNPSFDADGNMSAGPVPGSAGNTPGIQAPANATEMKWDAENRLVFMKIGTQPFYYGYDHLSRLIARGEQLPIRRHYCYDGWNRITEYVDAAVIDTFTWGTDLSGSMQGAGGVGGLLATRWVSSGNTDYFPTYDGNGNVSEYLRTTGGIAAHYEYDPFGRLTRLTGQTDTRFQYRFSTKPRDITMGLYYYGYRWYDPLTGRWPSRDPIEEEGGINMYVFIVNSTVYSYDYLGLLVETPWDMFSVGVGIAEFAFCVSTGNIVGSIAAGAALGVDIAAAVTPGIPGGASIILKGYTRVALRTSSIHIKMHNSIKATNDGAKLIRYLVTTSDEAHHIIPKGFDDCGKRGCTPELLKIVNGMRDLKDRMRKAGLNIDSLENLVSLDTQYHTTTQRSNQMGYAKYIINVFKDVNGAGIAKKLDELATDMLKDSVKLKR